MKPLKFSPLKMLSINNVPSLHTAYKDFNESIRKAKKKMPLHKDLPQ